MPLYEYKCEKCGMRFEELINSKEALSVIPCRSCGMSAVKQVSSFAPVVAGGSSNETVDMAIGRAANSRWQKVHDDRSKRLAGKELKTFNMPKSKDGKYMPVMALGDKKVVEKRKEYVSALQNHRKVREARGIPQISGTGAF